MSTIPSIQEEIRRFENVVSMRKQLSDLLDLFDKLAVSDKFTDLAKPWCFARLLDIVLQRVSDRQLGLVLAKVTKVKVVSRMLSGPTREELRPTMALLVKRMLTSAPRDEVVLAKLFRDFEAAEVSFDRADTLDLALTAGIDRDLLDEICNLTFAEYYGYDQAPF